MQKRWQMVTVHCVTKWCPHCSLVILKQIRFTNILFVANILCSNLFGRDLFLKFIQVESTFWWRTMVGKFFFLCLSILRTRSRFTSIVFRDIKRNTTVFHNYIKSGGNTSAHCMSRQCFVFTGCIVFLAIAPLWPVHCEMGLGPGSMVTYRAGLWENTYQWK